ncbi:hypothetical protein BCR42DRAFT_474956 [Absidia repens]|uniref:Uncharacterized protein n=1 Tax=Absidia repens TaxID=90262 RepID=A0A1X2ISE9_9FUNG|nr:hypothetical protein BCR42DRAFT_474956 [Absidia repens]
MNENIPVVFSQHIHGLFEKVHNETGSHINVSALIKRLVPVFYGSSESVPLATPIKNDRNTGYLAFYQSFSMYTIKHYHALSTIFLERILLQTVSLSPIAKISSCLRLGDKQYDSSYDTGDRLSILLGVLHSLCGSSAVDSFLHPLFTDHIFNEKYIQQPDQDKNPLQFESIIQSRGGTIDLDYQQLEVACPQTRYRWECTITYQLGTNTPFILHSRTGQSKKQAKLRAIHDIYNFYTRSDTNLILDCTSWLTQHPHSKSQCNIDQTNVKTLSISPDQMYEYDDDRYEHISLEKLISNRSNPNIIHIPADVDDEPDGGISILAQALLGEYADSNSTNDSSNASPSPGATKQSDPQLSSSSPLSSKRSLAPSTTNLPKPNNDYTTVDQLGIKHSPVMENHQHTIPLDLSPNSNRKTKTIGVPQEESCTDNTHSKSNRMEEIGLLNDQRTQTEPTTTLHELVALPLAPSSPPSAATATEAEATATEAEATTEKAPGTLFSTEEHLIEKALQLMDLFTLKERCRLNDYNDHLRHRPNDAKGILINLARKLDDGYYETAVEHVQLGKATERAHYIVTVRFGTPEIELSLARGHTKKSTAEGLAALALFILIDKASKNINTQMDLPFLQ